MNTRMSGVTVRLDIQVSLHASSCGHGQCIDEHQGVRCDCEVGYTGKFARIIMCPLAVY